MSIIIDGYNLLCGAGIVAEASGPSTLEKSRRALLRFLVRVLTEEERGQTTVIFDAKNARSGLPGGYVSSDISVVFAPRGHEADEVIVEQIRAHSAPRQITVVSSDHYIQREARKRRAQAVDSDHWFRQRLSGLALINAAITPTAQLADEKPHGALSDDEVQRWLAQFEDPPVTLDDNTPSMLNVSQLKTPVQPLESQPPIWNPFPQGYGEDLLDGGES